MKWFKTGVFFISLVMVLMQGCKKDVDNNPAAPESTGTLTEVIEKASGINEIVHSTYFSELNSTYYSAFSLDLVLQSPEKRSLIKKIIIKDQVNNQGWEFSDKDLPKFYADSLKGYRFPHLIFAATGSYGQPVIDRFFKIKLYGYDNSTSDDFEFVLKANTLSVPQSIYSDWFDKSLLSITTIGCPRLPKEVKVNWLQNGTLIGQSTATNKLMAPGAYYSSYMVSTVSDVPENADSYYLSFSDENVGGSKSLFISNQYLIPNRLPVQSVMLPDGITIDGAVHAKGPNKVVMINTTGKKLYIMNFDNNTIEKTLDLVSAPAAGAMYYSADSNKVYIGTKTGTLYAYNFDQNKLETVYNFGSEIYGLAVANKFVIASIRDNIASLRLDTKEITYWSAYSNTFTDMVYNKVNNAVYGRSNYSSSYLFRLEFNQVTGGVTGVYYYRYYGSYYINAPVKLFPDGLKVINGSGTIFSCTQTNSNDMVYLGNIAAEGVSIAFTDLVFSPDRAKFITVMTSATNYSGQVIPGKLQLFDAQTYVQEKSLPLAGSPKYIFNNNDKLLMLSYLANSGRYFVQPFSYAGLLQSNSPARMNGSLGHFFSKKL